MNIFSGSLVALYNRVKSQTVTTRYLGMDGSPVEWISKTNEWDVFTIWLSTDPRIDKSSLSSNQETQNGSNSSQDSFTQSIDLYYGSSIILQHVKTGYMTNPMVIYQCIDKNIIEMSGKIGNYLD